MRAIRALESALSDLGFKTERSGVATAKGLLG